MSSQSLDYILLGVVGILLLVGVLVLAGVSAPFALRNFGSASSYLWHQLLFGFLPGLLLGAGAFTVSLRMLQRLAPWFLFGNLLFLLLVFFPATGVSLGGAMRWAALGPIVFQPSEFLKLTFILYLGVWLVSRVKEPKTQRNNSNPRGLLIPFIIIIGIIGFLLVAQPDISTLGVITVTGFLVYFAARTPLWHSAVLILIGISALAALIKLAPYRMHRLLVFLNPSLDPMGIGYQIKQALIAVGSGGFIGIGLGMSYKQLHYLPSAMSDAIFAAFAQEMGFIGSFLLAILFFVFIWRGLKTAKDSPDEFSRLVASGITFWIGLQAFVNISSITGLLPLAGIPLPFLSYGGSHLIAELAGVGILLNISRQK